MARQPSAAAVKADAIRKVAADYGFTVTAKIRRDWNRATGEFDGKVIDATVTVECQFTPGDVAAYRQAESRAYELVREFPAVKSGSTWGTTSDGVGGHAGLTAGEMRLSKSGVSVALARQFA